MRHSPEKSATIAPWALQYEKTYKDDAKVKHPVNGIAIHVSLLSAGSNHAQPLGGEPRADYGHP